MADKDQIDIFELLPMSNRQLNNLHNKYEINNVTGCWEIKMAKSYSCMRINGILVPAHRVFYTIYNGPISKGMIICHTCDNPRCINPNHLFQGTKKDNAVDASNKGRIKQGYDWSRDKTHCKRGHAYSEDNTKWRKNGTRECIACGKIRRSNRTNGV